MLAKTPSRELGLLKQGFGIRQRPIMLSLSALVVLLTACQTSTAVDPWTPPYLSLQLVEGRAQVQPAGSSEWTTLERGARITVNDSVHIIADSEAGARFQMDDESTIELAPDAEVEAQGSQTLPRLQIALSSGDLLFIAQEPSYEFVAESYQVTVLSIPSQMRLEADDGTTRLAVEAGALSCRVDGETLTLFECQEIYIGPDLQPEVAHYCTEHAAVPSPTATRMPTTTPVPSPYLLASRNVVNIRSGPGLYYPVLYQMESGTEAPIVGYYGEWWQILTGDGLGWVFDGVVTAFYTDGVPEVQPPPAPTAVPATATPPPASAPPPQGPSQPPGSGPPRPTNTPLPPVDTPVPPTSPPQPTPSRPTPTPGA